MTTTAFVNGQTPIVASWLNDVNDNVYNATGLSGSSISRTVQQKNSDTISVKDFGAVGDGVVDDTLSIQTAINTGLNIYFPSGRYLITNTLLVSTRGQGFYGNGGSIGGKSDILTDDFGSTLQFSLDDAAVETPMILVTLSQCTFNCLKFCGDSGNTVDIGIKFQKVSNTDDMDGYVYDCDFYNIYKPIYFYGRALHADRNVFSSLNSGIAITLDWPTSGTSGDDIQTDDLYKGRAHRITNNRYHSGGGVFVVVTGYIQRSAIYALNCIDIGNEFIRIEAGAGLDGAIINGNVADLCGVTPINFKALSYCLNVVISNNRLGGSIVNTIDGDDTQPFAAVSFDGPAQVDGLLINGNLLTGTGAGAIAFLNDAASPLITVSNINITNNLIQSVGLDGAASRWVVYSSFDISGCIFSNNSISSLGATVVSLFRSASKTITNSVIRGNIYNTTLPVVTTTSLAGTTDDGRTTSGTYTPIQVSTNVNVASVTFNSCQYARVGSVVIVSGRLDIDATVIGDTTVKMSIPIPSNFANGWSATGTFTQYGAVTLPSIVGSITSDATNDCVVLRVNSATAASQSYVLNFTYQVI